MVWNSSRFRSRRKTKNVGSKQPAETRRPPLEHPTPADIQHLPGDEIRAVGSKESHSRGDIFGGGRASYWRTRIVHAAGLFVRQFPLLSTGAFTHIHRSSV